MASIALQVILVGFPAPEKATFETFFRLIASRRPGPLTIATSLSQSNVILWNADSDVARPSLIPGAQLLVAVSKAHVDDVWRHVSRPVNLNSVLHSLDAAYTELGIVASASTLSTPSTPTPSALDRQSVTPPVASSAPADPSTRTAPRVVSLARPARVESIPTPQPLTPSTPTDVREASVTKDANVVSEQRPQVRIAPTSSQRVIPKAIELSVPPIDAASPSPKPTHILVVDDSDVALRFMHSRLSAFGFSVDLCGSGEEALVKVSEGEYAFVFLDVMMAGLDGYQTCKAIKGRRYPASRSPTVVMLTSRGGTIDKVRGTFAGCDAYLTKPLDEAKMLKVLLRFSPDLADSVSTFGQARSAPSVSHARGTGNPLSASFENLPPGVVKQRG